MPPRRDRPHHLQLGPIALVLVGGAVGTAARAAIEAGVPHTGAGFPWATFAANVSGALLLGLLVEVLAHHRATVVSAAAAQRLRLLLGTGMLGGYTTYSTLVVQTLQLGDDGDLTTAMLYAVATVVAGFAAAAAAMTAYRHWRIGRDRIGLSQDAGDTNGGTHD